MRGFWRGFMTHAAVLSLYQDSLGMEKYIEAVKSGWVSEFITVPLAIVVLLAVVAGVFLEGLSEVKDRL